MYIVHWILIGENQTHKFTFSPIYFHLYYYNTDIHFSVGFLFLIKHHIQIKFVQSSTGSGNIFDEKVSHKMVWFPMIFIVR